MKWTILLFALSACFKERIFPDVVLSIPFKKRKISSTSVVQTLPYQLTGTSTVKLYTPVCANMEFGPANLRETQTWGNMSKCLVSSRNRSKPWAAHYSFSSETDWNNVKPPTTCYADRHRDISLLLAEFPCKLSHFHWSHISASSGTRHGAVSSTLFRQYPMWLLWWLPFERNLQRWSVRVRADWEYVLCSGRTLTIPKFGIRWEVIGFMKSAWDLLMCHTCSYVRMTSKETYWNLILRKAFGYYWTVIRQTESGELFILYKTYISCDLE